MIGELVATNRQWRGLTDKDVWMPGVGSTTGHEEALSIRNGFTWVPPSLSSSEPQLVEISMERRGQVIKFCFDSTRVWPHTPNWLAPTLCSFAEVLTIPANWDSYGARPIQPGVASSALDSLFAVMRDSTPLPSVVPTAKGGIQLEWHSRRFDLEVVFQPGENGEVYCEDKDSSTEWGGRLSDVVQRLNGILAELAD